MIFGFLGSEIYGTAATPLPGGLGTACFPPPLLLPSFPLLFTVGDVLGLTGPLLPPASLPSPGSVVLSIPGPQSPITLILQAVMTDTSAAPPSFRLTNTIRLIIP